MEKYIKPSRDQVRWAKFDNSTGERTLHHCMKSKTRLLLHYGKYTGETEEGNISLCGHASIVEDDSRYLTIDEINRVPLDRLRACKKCLSIYEELL